jgi:hypothetical protein
MAWAAPACRLAAGRQHSLPPAAAAACGCAGADAFVSTEKGQVSVLLSPSLTYMLTIKPTGHLVIQNVATGEETMCVGPFKGCAPPYKLNLQPNGNLVYSGKNGRIFWTSQTACLGTPCYTYKLQDSGEMQVGGPGWDVHQRSTASHPQRPPCPSTPPLRNCTRYTHSQVTSALHPSTDSVWLTASPPPPLL